MWCISCGVVTWSRGQQVAVVIKFTKHENTRRLRYDEKVATKVVRFITTDFRSDKCHRSEMFDAPYVANRFKLLRKQTGKKPALW